MRHRKHNHLLGVKTAHRTSLLANLSCSLIENGRIKTTLAKARALRPTIEKAITLAKKANATDDAAKKVHYRRLAISRLRSKPAVKKLFDELVEQFVNRNGGYTRIYKLAMPRLGDAADMAIIEFVEDAPKKKTKKKKASAKKASKDKKETTPKVTDDSEGEDAKEEPEAASEESAGQVSEEPAAAEEDAGKDGQDSEPETEKEEPSSADESAESGSEDAPEESEPEAVAEESAEESSSEEEPADPKNEEKSSKD